MYAIWVKDYDITVEKEWQDESNKFGDHIPESITVELLKNNGQSFSPKRTIIIRDDGEGNWTGTFRDLPAFESNGNEIRYTVEESEITGWQLDGITYGNNLAYVNYVNYETPVQITNSPYYGKI